MTSLQDAIEFLHHKVYVEESPTSPIRMDVLAEYVIEELEERGISGWETEISLNAFAREKRWDVVHRVGGKPRVAITLKSILRNLAGTVPNRTDDLIGEVTDLQMRYPEIIIGYLVVMDEAETDRDPNAPQWVDTMERRLEGITGRRPPFWGRGSLEASKVIRTNLAGEGNPELHTTESDMDTFFETIDEQYELRFRFSDQESMPGTDAPED